VNHALIKVAHEKLPHYHIARLDYNLEWVLSYLEITESILENDQSPDSETSWTKVLGPVVYDAWHAIVIWDSVITKLVHLQQQLQSHDIKTFPFDSELPEDLRRAFMAAQSRLELVIEEHVRRLKESSSAMPKLRANHMQVKESKKTAEALGGDYLIETSDREEIELTREDGCKPIFKSF